MSTSKSQGDDARVNSVRENSIYYTIFVIQVHKQQIIQVIFIFRVGIKNGNLKNVIQNKNV